MGVVDRLDRYQRGHSWVGFPLAVAYKLFDDRGPYLAALVTYYAFVSLFPLLLLLVSATGFFLDGAPHLRQQLIDAAVRNFPGVGSTLRQNINGYHGSGIGLAIGIVGTLYGGTGATQAAQAAFNHIYAVPRNEQPNPLRSRIRSIGLIALLGTAVLLSTGIASLVSTANSVNAGLGPWVRAAGYLLSLAINVGLFTAAFQLLTARRLIVRRVITGGILAGVSWVLLQTFGSRYVSHEVNHSGTLYGVFGVVLAVLAWIYLQALMLMISAEINVVLHRRLWPRALLTPFTDEVELTDADTRAYSSYSGAQRYKGFQHVHTDFDRSPDPAAAGPEAVERMG